MVITAVTGVVWYGSAILGAGVGAKALVEYALPASAKEKCRQLYFRAFNWNEKRSRLLAKHTFRIEELVKGQKPYYPWGREQKLKDLATKIPQEKPIILYGPSGAGKTTLIPALMKRRELSTYTFLELRLPTIDQDHQTTATRVLKIFFGEVRRQVKEILEIVREMENEDHKYVVFIDEAEKLLDVHSQGFGEPAEPIWKEIRQSLTHPRVRLILAMTDIDFDNRWPLWEGADQRRWKPVEVPKMDLMDFIKVMTEPAALREYGERYDVALEGEAVEWLLRVFNYHKKGAKCHRDRATYPDQGVDLLREVCQWAQAQSISQINQDTAEKYLVEVLSWDKLEIGEAYAKSRRTEVDSRRLYRSFFRPIDSVADRGTASRAIHLSDTLSVLGQESIRRGLFLQVDSSERADSLVRELRSASDARWYDVDGELLIQYIFTYDRDKGTDAALKLLLFDELNRARREGKPIVLRLRRAERLLHYLLISGWREADKDKRVHSANTTRQATASRLAKQGLDLVHSLAAQIGMEDELGQLLAAAGAQVKNSSRQVRAKQTQSFGGSDQTINQFPLVKMLQAALENGRIKLVYVDADERVESAALEQLEPVKLPPLDRKATMEMIRKVGCQSDQVKFVEEAPLIAYHLARCLDPDGSALDGAVTLLREAHSLARPIRVRSTSPQSPCRNKGKQRVEKDQGNVGQEQLIQAALRAARANNQLLASGVAEMCRAFTYWIEPIHRTVQREKGPISLPHGDRLWASLFGSGASGMVFVRENSLVRRERTIQHLFARKEGTVCWRLDIRELGRLARRKTLPKTIALELIARQLELLGQALASRDQDAPPLLLVVDHDSVWDQRLPARILGQLARRFSVPTLYFCPEAAIAVDEPTAGEPKRAGTGGSIESALGGINQFVRWTTGIDVSQKIREFSRPLAEPATKGNDRPQTSTSSGESLIDRLDQARPVVVTLGPLGPDEVRDYALATANTVGCRDQSFLRACAHLSAVITSAPQSRTVSLEQVRVWVSGSLSETTATERRTSVQRLADMVAKDLRYTDTQDVVDMLAPSRWRQVRAVGRHSAKTVSDVTTASVSFFRSHLLRPLMILLPLIILKKTYSFSRSVLGRMWSWI